MQDHRNLDVSVRAVGLAEQCYAVTARFTDSERFALRSQMQRAAISVASNIAEGRGRGSDRDFARFLRIAYGSACELDTQAHIAQRVGVGSPHDLKHLISETNEVRRMINALIRRVADDRGK
jgi:four helix bundle protein